MFRYNFSNIKTSKSCITARYDAVENEFCKFKLSCGRADVARIANVIPADGNALAVEVILVRFEFAPKFCVGDFLAPIGGISS